jgi:hypothetical protein
MRQYALSAPRASCGTAENWNSANFAFWAFCEVRIHGVLRSSAVFGAVTYFVPQRTYIRLRQEYAAFVTWPADAT